MKIFYDSTYDLEGYDTTRKAKWIYDSLCQNPIRNVEVISPPLLDETLLKRVHCQRYINTVRSGSPIRLAESQGLRWSPDLWRSVTASTMGVVAAAQQSLNDGVSGSLSSGLHHAQYARGAGYCTFNGLVVAAEHLHQEGVEHILILDLDAHFGGGTNSLLVKRGYIHHVDVSVSRFDRYPVCPCQAGTNPRPFRTALLITNSDEYLRSIEICLEKIEELNIKFGACLYNAGVDPHENCMVGGIDGITTDTLHCRDQMVFEWCKRRGVPISFALAGGYIGTQLSVETLVGLHRGTIEAAARTIR
ncbi:MAG: hypothetical protein K9M11_00635 [Candidatus Pacebacteria bacterium]|nr:hypothetical protein [Candidatus Paceibacterota bacterium]